MAHPWYQLKVWCHKPTGLRWQTLVRDLFTCQVCKATHSNTAQLVADHIKPHKGDWGLFTDPGNLRCVCKACHDGHIQSQNRTGILRGVGSDGRPIDPSHPWNRPGGR